MDNFNHIMRHVKILIVWAIIVFPSNLQAQTLCDTLTIIDYHKYLDKPIDSLLSDLPQSFDKMFTGSACSMFVGAVIVICYPDSDLMLKIYPSTSNYFERVNYNYRLPSEAWPLHNVRKENLGRVILSDLDPYPILDVE